jgi:hypothetical protein
MADRRRQAPQRGDEAQLFRAYNDQLVRKVAAAVRASHDVVEDACAFAWAQFLVHQPDRDQEWQGSLFRTAQREAWALLRKDRRASLHFSQERELGGLPDPLTRATQ